MGLLFTGLKICPSDILHGAMIIFPFLKNAFIYDCSGSFLLHRLSLVAVSRGYSLVATCGLLVVVASL